MTTLQTVIYISFRWLGINPDGYPEMLFENKIIWIDPAGEIIAEYLKSRPVPGEGCVSGSGKIPVLETPYGRIATTICFDMDFANLINQAGKSYRFIHIWQFFAQ